MSLTVSVKEGNVDVRYEDEGRRAHIQIDVAKGSISIIEHRNVKVIIEPKVVELRDVLHVEDKLKVIAASKHELHQRVAEEFTRLLKAENALSEGTALTLDKVLEIAQFRGQDFPAINQAIKEYGLSGLKQRLPLLVKWLLKRGVVKCVEKHVNREVTRKYYIER